MEMTGRLIWKMYYQANVVGLAVLLKSSRKLNGSRAALLLVVIITCSYTRLNVTVASWSAALPGCRKHTFNPLSVSWNRDVASLHAGANKCVYKSTTSIRGTVTCELYKVCSSLDEPISHWGRSSLWSLSGRGTNGVIFPFSVSNSGRAPLLTSIKYWIQNPKIVIVNWSCDEEAERMRRNRGTLINPSLRVRSVWIRNCMYSRCNLAASRPICISTGMRCCIGGAMMEIGSGAINVFASCNTTWLVHCRFKRWLDVSARRISASVEPAVMLIGAIMADSPIVRCTTLVGNTGDPTAPSTSAAQSDAGGGWTVNAKPSTSSIFTGPFGFSTAVRLMMRMP